MIYTLLIESKACHAEQRYISTVLQFTKFENNKKMAEEVYNSASLIKKLFTN